VIDREKYALELPDGTHVTSTINAANEYGTTPPAFLIAAKKAGLTRYAKRTAKSQIAHYWIVDEVEDLVRQRLGAAIRPDTDSPFIEAPYEIKGG
jgi:hypothetical protein